MPAISTPVNRRAHRIPTKSVLLGIATAMMLGIGASIVLAIGNGTPAAHAAVIYWLSLSYTACGLVTWWQRPTNRLGPLMILTGFSTLATTLSWAGAASAQAIGQALDLLPTVLIVHVFLAFPTGRIRHPLDRILITVGYVAAIGVQLVVIMLGGPGSPTLLALVDDPAAATLLHNLELVVLSAVAVASVGILVARRRADGRPLRRSLALLIDSFAVGLLMIAALLLVGVFGGPFFPTVQWISLALLGLAPVAFLARLLDTQLARTAVGDLVLKLRAEPADLRTPLALALRDPSLSVAYWLPQFDSWADQDGRPVDLPTDSRRVTSIDPDGHHSAVLIHDPALRDEPALLDAVTAAAASALDTGRLQAELRASVQELRGSRERVLQAGQKERQRLERDLHDGAQQRLVALSLSLGVLESKLGADADATAGLAKARQEIAASLVELRDVARGLHPAVLSAHGLAVALESLAARAPLPVRLKVDLDGRLAEAVEVTAYYVVSECLTNIGKHAEATLATVDVMRLDGQVMVEVVDDGRGGADAERGGGLRGLADRVEALGGRLQVWTPRGRGTRVRAELPCG
jgi:signal transduction histidine kinase